MARSPRLWPLLMFLTLPLGWACSGTVQGNREREGKKTPDAPGDKTDGTPSDPTPGDQPDPGVDEPAAPGQTPVARKGVRGILDCPTVPLPAYGAATSSDLSKPFQSNCAACHGGVGQGKDKYPAIPGKLTRDEYIAKVRAGVREMPAFNATFVTDAQLASDYDTLKRLGSQLGGLAAAQSNPDSWSEAEVEEKYQAGLKIWRKAGSIDGQACTNCHSADGVELAIIGFPDDSILRRGQQHLAPEDALVVRDFIHAQRRRLGIAETCATDWRPFQPGGQVLPGATAAEQDASFMKELQKRNLLVATGKVVTVADANKALAEMQAIDLRKLPMGIPMPRWSEDKFNGPEHRDINDYMAPVPTVPNKPTEYFALEDEYLRNPTDANLYRLLEENRTNMNDLGYRAKNTTPAVPGNCSRFPDSTTWIMERITIPKRLSVLVAAHLFREELAKPGSFYERPASPFPDAPAPVNPAFFMGGFAIEPPCYDDNNYPYWIKSFPSSFREEFPQSDLDRGVVENATDRITHVWMMLGQILDPTLIATDNMQNNKIHYWAFRNFTQKQVHLPFVYVHRMAMQVKYWKEMRDSPLFPKVRGPFDEASREWLHPFLATENQNSSGLRSAVSPTDPTLPGADVNRLKGNLIRMMLLISRDLLRGGMPLQSEQNDDHCLAVTCQVKEMRGYFDDLRKHVANTGTRAAYMEKGFDVDFYLTDTEKLLDEVLSLMAMAPRR